MNEIFDKVDFKLYKGLKAVKGETGSILSLDILEDAFECKYTVQYTSGMAHYTMNISIDELNTITNLHF